MKRCAMGSVQLSDLVSHSTFSPAGTLCMLAFIPNCQSSSPLLQSQLSLYGKRIDLIGVLYCGAEWSCVHFLLCFDEIDGPWNVRLTQPRLASGESESRRSSSVGMKTGPGLGTRKKEGRCVIMNLDSECSSPRTET